MSKKKLAIVSSYDELCGNAAYTKALADGLSQLFDVAVISLNVELLRKGDSKSAKHHIEEICTQLKTFDCVNIQFEAGLFGSNPQIVEERFFTIAKSCKKLVLTMHRYHPKQRYPTVISLGKQLLKGALKPFIGSAAQAYANNRYCGLYDKIIKYCKRKSIPIVVHTPRDCELIKIKYHHDKVYDHPLCYYTQSYIESQRKNISRKEFCEAHSLDPSKSYIGIFGFISKYKGYETVINALEYLPENYVLLIFGAQHPHTVQLDEPLNEYIGQLLKLIKEKKLSDRVKFCGSLSDDDFLNALICCDFNVLPYLEVNQGGSAVAALALETNSKTIFSRNYAFTELSKYAPNSFKMVTIGNYLELANAIQSYRQSDYAPGLKSYHAKYNISTSSQLYKSLYEA